MLDHITRFFPNTGQRGHNNQVPPPPQQDRMARDRSVCPCNSSTLYGMAASAYGFGALSCGLFSTIGCSVALWFCCRRARTAEGASKSSVTIQEADFEQQKKENGEGKENDAVDDQVQVTIHSASPPAILSGSSGSSSSSSASSSSTS